MMELDMKFTLGRIPAAAALLMLAACGGGNSGSSTTPTVTPTSGLAVDGYLKQANVTCDANSDGLVSSGEVTVTTDAVGAFSFPSGCSYGIIVKGGINVDTDQPFTGVLKAPAGAKVATPLTTLLVGGMAPAELKTSLGLDASMDLLTLDPAAKTGDTYTNLALFQKTLAVQQLMQKTAESLGGLASATGSDALQPIYTEVAKAFATAMKSSSSVNLASSSTALNQTLVESLVSAATTRVAASETVSASVRTALGSVNSDTFAAVIGSSLKVQADAILQSSGSTLVSVTTTQQTDDKVSAFALEKKTSLNLSATSTEIAVLKTTLSESVSSPSTPVVANNYIKLVDNTISLKLGSASTPFTAAAFQSAAGISVAWPLSTSSMLDVSLAEVGTFTIEEGKKLSAAFKVTDESGSSAEVRGFIDNISIAKTSSGLVLQVASTATAKVYGVSSDGKKKAVINFSSSVAGITNTLKTTGSNSIILGDVVNYAITSLSNDFTGISGLRGKYKVTLVISDLPLRKADGTKFELMGVDVPTGLSSVGATTSSSAVVGYGLTGYITLTN
jgi:hypothetical protein